MDDRKRLESEILRVSEGVLSLLDEKKLIGNLTISFEPKFTKAVAQACFQTGVDSVAMRFQWPLWQVLLPDERMEVVAHEICHGVAARRWSPEIAHHGREWKSLMKACGYANAGATLGLNPVASAHLRAKTNVRRK